MSQYGSRQMVLIVERCGCCVDLINGQRAAVQTVQITVEFGENCVERRQLTDGRQRGQIIVNLEVKVVHTMRPTGKLH